MRYLRSIRWFAFCPVRPTALCRLHNRRSSKAPRNALRRADRAHSQKSSFLHGILRLAVKDGTLITFDPRESHIFWRQSKRWTFTPKEARP